MATKTRKSASKKAAKTAETGKLQSHPFAELLPMMTGDEKEALRASIEASGQHDPIELFEGKVLDGRNRLEVLNDLKITPKFKEFKGTPAAALQRVIDRATHRSMNASQKAGWGVGLILQSQNGSFPGGKEGASANLRSENGKISDHVARIVGASARLIEMAKQVYDNDDAERTEFRKIMLGGSVHSGLQAIRKKTAHRVLKKQLAVPANLDDCQLLLGDVVEKLSTLASKSVRCICTDPPYNIGKKYHNDATGDLQKDAEFLSLCSAWVDECVRVLTPDGSIFVMMNGQYAARLEIIMRSAGLFRRNTIYWWENNPENQKGNFSDAVRQILYFVKDPENFIFNDDVRIPSKRNEIGDKRGIDGGKLPDNVWIDNRIPGNALDRVPFPDAPPQLPLSIPETIVRVASEPGDTILDPFNGNGTAAIAALRHGRKYIGIDKSSLYLNQSRKWIAANLAKPKE